MMIWYQQSTTKTPFFVILSLFVSFLNEKTISKCIIISQFHTQFTSFFLLLSFVLICPLIFWFRRSASMVFFFSFFLYVSIGWRPSSYLDIVLLFHVQLCHTLSIVFYFLLSGSRRARRSYSIPYILSSESRQRLWSFLSCVTHKIKERSCSLFFLALYNTDCII